MTGIAFYVFALNVVGIVITGLLFVLFGVITVRRLRKLPELKEALGFEYVSGRDIVNVATALGIPRYLNRKVRKTGWGFMFADADAIYPYTTRLDRALAYLFCWTFFVTGSALIVCGILYQLKIID